MKRDERQGVAHEIHGRQAAKATGVSTAAITRALKYGKNSGHKDDSGAWVIDPAELHRVFPLVSPKEHERDSAKKGATQNERPDTMALEREMQTLRETLADLRQDRDRWRDMAERLSLVSPAPADDPNPKRRHWWPRKK